MAGVSLDSAFESALAVARASKLACSVDVETPPGWCHSGQLAVWADDSVDVIACAGSQGGKTALNAYWLLREIFRTRHLAEKLGVGNYLYVGPTLTLLDAQAIPSLERLLVDELQLGRLVKGTKPKFYFSPEGAVRLIGKAVPLVIHFAYANDSQNLESMTALGAVWDEAGQPDNKELSYEALMRRLKVARSQGAGRCLYSTTPYDWTWFKRRLVDPLQGSGRGYHSWPSWLNPLVSESGVRKELADGMPEWRWRMMYMAEWTRPAGAVYGCFDDRIETDSTGETNVVETFKPGDDWKIYIGWDFGSANTAAVILAKDPDTGVYYVCAEYHGAGEFAANHIKEVKALLNGRKVSLAVGGAASEDRHRMVFAQAGMNVHPPSLRGADSVEAGINAVYKGFATKKLKIMAHCTRTRRDVQAMTRQTLPDGTVTEHIIDKQLYHLPDAIRYIYSTIETTSPLKKYVKSNTYISSV